MLQTSRLMIFILKNPATWQSERLREAPLSKPWG